VTNDIAIMLSTPTKDAELLKCERGCALVDLVAPEESIEVPGIDERPNRKMSRQEFVQVIQARLEEIYKKIREELIREGFLRDGVNTTDRLPSGLVITGGAAQMPGMIELGEETLHMPVRLGVPKYSGSFADIVCAPRFATAYGLLLSAHEDWLRGRKAAGASSWTSWLHKVRNVINNTF